MKSCNDDLLLYKQNSSIYCFGLWALPSQILGVAVEVVEFLRIFQGNFVLGDETKLIVCKCSKILTSAKNTSKISEVSCKDRFTH